MVRKSAAALAALGVLLVGCAEPGSLVTPPSSVVPVSPSPRPSGPANPPVEHTHAEPAPVQIVDPDLYRTETEYNTFYRFVSPTGNLLCGFNLYEWGNDVGCQSGDVPKPEHSSVHGGHCSSSGVIIDEERARHTCFHDGQYTSGPDERVLDYGTTITVGDMTCTSDVTGMTCFYRDHGFFLAREQVVLY